MDGGRDRSKTSNYRPFHIVLVFLPCAFTTNCESKIGVGGQGAIGAYVNSKGGSRQASSEKPGRDEGAREGRWQKGRTQLVRQAARSKGPG